MDLSSVKRVVTFLLVLICAILVANTLSNILIAAIGLTGIPAFIIGFLVYAAIFFAMLYFFERVFGIRVFSF